MAPQAAQTPMVLVKAGGVLDFNDACKAALRKCGYDPEDFGTYDEVRGKIKKAKAACDEYDALSAQAKKTTPAPTDSQRFLSQCQSGHLTQDAIFRNPGGRDSPCDNHPGAEGNDTGLAPCMPHFGKSSAAGSIHQDITADEPRNAKEHGNPGDPMAPKQIEDCARKTAATALQAAKEARATDDPQKLLKEADKLEDKRKGKKGAEAKKLLEKERQTRRAGSAGMQQASAADLAKGKAKPSSTQAGRAATVDLAADCIELYRKRGLDKMRKQVIAENSTANKKAAQRQAAKSLAEKERELAAAKRAGKGVSAAQKEVDKAQKAKDKADQRANNPTPDEKCLESQANILEKKLPRLPRMTGKVPGKPATLDSTGRSGQSDEDA